MEITKSRDIFPYTLRYIGIAGWSSTISLSHDDEYPPFLGGIQFSLINADN
jgi:hypothetical protein